MWKIETDEEWENCSKISEWPAEITDEQGETVCYFTEWDSDLAKYDELWQNARLIAASNDLLAASKEGLEMSKFAAALNFEEGVGNTQEYLDELKRMLEHFQTTAITAIKKAQP